MIHSTIGQIEDEASMASIDKVIQAVDSVQGPIVSYIHLKEELMKHGLTIELANWLSTSVKRVSQKEYQFKFKTSIIRELLKSYRNADYWSLLGNPPENCHIRLVRAERNKIWTEDVVERLEILQSVYPQQFSMCVVENAGHWIQVHNPDGLYKAIRNYL